MTRGFRKAFKMLECEISAEKRKRNAINQSRQLRSSQVALNAFRLHAKPQNSSSAFHVRLHLNAEPKKVL